MLLKTSRTLAQAQLTEPIALNTTTPISSKSVTAPYTISELETAINYWRERQASGEDSALCYRARVLADAYGLLIFNGANSVDARELSPDQNEALSLALSQGELPL